MISKDIDNFSFWHTLGMASPKGLVASSNIYLLDKNQVDIYYGLWDFQI